MIVLRSLIPLTPTMRDRVREQLSAAQTINATTGAVLIVDGSQFQVFQDNAVKISEKPAIGRAKDQGAGQNI